MIPSKRKRSTSVEPSSQHLPSFFTTPPNLPLPRFLVNDVKGAEEDLLASIELIPSFTQSWVKIASVYMEQGNPDKTFEAFEEAIKHNPNDPDIYYHRGQGQ